MNRQHFFELNHSFELMKFHTSGLNDFSRENDQTTHFKSDGYVFKQMVWNAQPAPNNFFY